MQPFSDRPARLKPMAGALAIAWVLLGAPGLTAQDERATVRLDSRPVLRVAGTDTADAGSRAERIERRLGTLAGVSGTVGPARTERNAAGEPVITVSGIPLLTVTRADAEANVSASDTLAIQWARAIDRELIAARARRSSRTGEVGAGVEGALPASVSRLRESVVTVIPLALAAMVVLALTWGLAAAVRRLLRALFQHLISDRTVENLIRQIAYYAIWVVGFSVAVDALGFRPQTVVTGLGLTGLALGFALKDIISNFVSGLLLLALRPFELGDEIVVRETEGRVERIELRATQIRTYDGRVVLVPNADIFTSLVVNNTAAPVRRGTVDCFIGYADDLRRAADALRTAAAGVEGVLPEPPCQHPGPRTRGRRRASRDSLLDRFPPVGFAGGHPCRQHRRHRRSACRRHRASRPRRPEAAGGGSRPSSPGSTSSMR